MMTKTQDHQDSEKDRAEGGIKDDDKDEGEMTLSNLNKKNLCR